MKDTAKLENNGKVLNALVLALIPIIAYSMFYFWKVYDETGVFKVDGNLEDKAILISITLVILTASSLYNSTINTFLYALISKLRREIKERDEKNERLVKDLSSTVNLFFSVFLRKERENTGVCEDELSSIVDITSRNEIEVNDQ